MFVYVVQVRIHTISYNIYIYLLLTQRPRSDAEFLPKSFIQLIEFSQKISFNNYIFDELLDK